MAKEPVQNVYQSPWGEQANYLTYLFGNAKTNYLNQNQELPEFRPFAGQTYANFSPQTEKALNETEQRALAGSPVQRNANTQLSNTLNGDYLYGNPGFNAAFQAAANKITPMVQSGFNRGGRLHSGLAREAETRALSDAFASQYGNERENQLRAMFFAPQAAEAEYNDLRRLAGVGETRDALAQAKIDEDMWRHEANQLDPWERLARYAQMIQGNYGTNQKTTGFKGSRLAGILGGALAGHSSGAPGGSVLGALAGLF